MNRQQLKYYIYQDYNLMRVRKQRSRIPMIQNASLTILDGNNFFTLNNKNQDHGYSIGNNFYTNRFMNVQSAQYHRKYQNLSFVVKGNMRKDNSSSACRSELDHKQRQSVIQCRKRIKSTNASISFNRDDKYRTQRQNGSNGKQKIQKIFNINPQQFNNKKIKMFTYYQNIQKKTNSFSENYKNKKKLMDRLTQKKINLISKSLKLDHQYKYALQNDWKQFSKSFHYGKKDILMQSIFGNKILYSGMKLSKNKKLPLKQTS